MGRNQSTCDILNDMTNATRTISINSDVLSYVLDRASEEDANKLRARADRLRADSRRAEPVIESGWVSRSLVRAAVELFAADEFYILRSFVAAYAQGLGSRPVPEGGNYALDVVDAFAGYEGGSLDSYYVDGASDALRNDMRNRLRASTYTTCWALVTASDMMSVIEEPWKDTAPFRTISWVEAQKTAIQELNDTDWSTRDSLYLLEGGHRSSPSDSLLGHSAIEYIVEHGGKAHRGDGNTRAHVLIGQGADTVLVHHTRPLGTELNGVAVSPEVTTF